MDKESIASPPPAPATAPVQSAPSVAQDYMDRWSRNLRLYETLKGMGLFVSPIPELDDPGKIRYMIVSADIPAPEGAAKPTTSRAPARDGARSATSAPPSDAANVVGFPTAR
jgi:hypothetical protein